MNPLSTQIKKLSQFSMSRFVKFLAALLVVIGGVSSAPAFSFWATKEGFMLPDPGSLLGYDRYGQTEYPDGSGWFTFEHEQSFAPHNLGEEFRWNTPVLYYSYDPSFQDYFGSNGVYAVDQGVGILNALSNIDDYSPDLSEFPLDEARFNLTAQALHLFDLKSATLEMLVTKLGLADPDRWTWMIHDRAAHPSCPLYDYTIIQRNFDPLTWAPSSYVNGNLLTYFIDQHCPPDTRGDHVDADERPVDPFAEVQSAVASPKITYPNIADLGMYHVGLTRDDVAGLRYLYSATNKNEEISPPDAQLFETNFTPILIVSSNLDLFAAQALTNDAAALQALYPGLIITGTSNIFTGPALLITNVTFFITNAPPWAPAGTFVFASVTNVTANFQPLFSHTFGNLSTFQFVNGQWVAVPITSLTDVTGHQIVATTTTTVSFQTSPFGIAGVGTIVSNTTTRFTIRSGPVGEFFIAPTNVCDLRILGAVFTNVVPQTNLIATVTNNTTGSNVVGVLAGTVIQTTFFTNHFFSALPVICTNNTVDVREGIQKINFVRHDFDPLFSRFFTPITNDYTMVAWRTNGSPTGHPDIQHFRRVVTRPDILFGAADLTGISVIETISRSRASFDTTLVVDPGLSNSPNVTVAGPGIFEGPLTLLFNKSGAVRLNSESPFNDQATSTFYYQWASFDGSTNAPFLYPNSATINDLENQFAFVVSPTFLPAGTTGSDYSATLSVSGGQAPFVWSIAPNSALPAGLTLTQNPDNSAEATISGTPVAAGITPVVIRVRDSGGLSLDTFYVITITGP